MTEPDWPQFRLTPLRVAELQPEACVAHVHPFLALTTQIKMLAAGGANRLAARLLDLVAEEYPLPSINFGMAARLVTAAIVARVPARAEAWLTEMLGASYRIRIDRGTSDLPAAVVRFHVSGGEASFQFSYSLFQIHTTEMLIGRWILLLPLLHRFMTSAHRIDGAVSISLDDGGGVPGLAFCDSRPGYFLIPDPHYLGQDQYREMVADFEAHPVAWEDRIPVAFWRGSTTGAPVDGSTGWRSLPRIRLSELSARFPDLIDAGITNVNEGVDEAGRQELVARNLMRPRVERRAFMQYRYQIDIDGNTNSWDGFFMRLLTGSPVLKVASGWGFQQWYYDRLVPWTHFVPVEADMSDLADKVRWLRENDEAARRIGEAGRTFAKTLTAEQELDHVGPVIAAAMRADAGGPVVDFSFQPGSSANRALVSGWHDLDALGVRSADRNYVVTLPLPPCLGDFVLLIDVSPSGSPVNLSVSSAGQIIIQQIVSNRTTLAGLLPRAQATANATFELSFAIGGAGVEPPRLTLYRAGLAKAPDRPSSRYPEVHALLASLNGQQPLPSPPMAGARTLYTWMGTATYFDLETGHIRHGEEAHVPRNLLAIRQGNGALLVRLSSDGSPDLIQLVPERAAAGRDPWVPWTAGATVEFEIHDVPGASGRHFGLSGCGLFLCAEPSGSVVLNRPRRSHWETFTFERFKVTG